jgi:hypothetical protein
LETLCEQTLHVRYNQTPVRCNSYLAPMKVCNTNSVVYSVSIYGRFRNNATDCNRNVWRYIGVSL